MNHKKNEVQRTDNICSQDAPPAGNAGAEHRNIKTGNGVSEMDITVRLPRFFRGRTFGDSYEYPMLQILLFNNGNCTFGDVNKNFITNLNIQRVMDFGN